MVELSLNEIQKIELNMLCWFHKICEEHNWRYSLGGGTLLGAIRHKGFIPWDDDVDVMMPRPDYDLFSEYCTNNNIPFIFLSYKTVKEYDGLFAKIWDPGTIIIEETSSRKYDLGVYIDIFPIDGLGNSEKEAIKIYNKTELKRELLVASSWKKYFRSKTHGIMIEPIRLGMFIFSRLINKRKLIKEIDFINLSYSFEECSYAGCVCGSYRKQEIMPKSTFDNYIYVTFEGELLKAIKYYHEYLEKHYGNYMQLPPESKQVTHHSYKAFRK